MALTTEGRVQLFPSVYKVNILVVQRWFGYMYSFINKIRNLCFALSFAYHYYPSWGHKVSRSIRLSTRWVSLITLYEICDWSLQTVKGADMRLREWRECKLRWRNSNFTLDYPWQRFCLKCRHLGKTLQCKDLSATES